MPYHLVAMLPNGRQKSIFNRDRPQTLDHITEFVRDGTLTTQWGNTKPTRQAYEIRVFETPTPYRKRTDGPFDAFISGRRNQFSKFEREAKDRLEPQRRRRVFVVMPIQGDEYGDQTHRNVYLEFTARFTTIENVLDQFDCVAIRIDREAPMGNLVDRIKREISRAEFVVADLTDERPSCYFEAGFAEALGKSIIFVASRESVMRPGENTKVHFDIHQNVQFFGNHDELAKKITGVIKKNRDRLLPERDESADSRWISIVSAATTTNLTNLTTLSPPLHFDATSNEGSG